MRTHHNKSKPKGVAGLSVSCACWNAVLRRAGVKSLIIRRIACNRMASASTIRWRRPKKMPLRRLSRKAAPCRDVVCRGQALPLIISPRVRHGQAGPSREISSDFVWPEPSGQGKPKSSPSHAKFLNRAFDAIFAVDQSQQHRVSIASNRFLDWGWLITRPIAPTPGRCG